MSTRPRSPGSLSRRRFLKVSATAMAAAPVLGPRILLGRPLESLNVACIGVGGMGFSDLEQVASATNVRIIALCDVDAANLARAAEHSPEARQFSDYRLLLDALDRDLDAVTISTPDHMHGSIALAALRRGKHVYCQKPIAHNLHECRLMTEVAHEQGLVTQMGTQIHSHEAYRTAMAGLRSGVIGKVSEAHLWVSKSWAGPAGGRPDKADPVPKQLDWDLWLGVASERPFVQGLYHPAFWRGWLDFGSGTLGDMGCHIFSPVFGALDLGPPRTVVSRGPAHGRETFAADGDILYEFEGTEWTTERLTLRWTDGNGPSRPDASRAQLPKDEQLPDAGSFLVGEQGVLVIPHWSMPKLYRNGQALDAKLEELPGKNHYHEWADACRGEGRTSCPFSFAGPLTEAVLLGTVAGRFQNQTLRFDAAKLKIDHAPAEALVRRRYRKGWEL